MGCERECYIDSNAFCGETCFNQLSIPITLDILLVTLWNECESSYYRLSMELSKGWGVMKYIIQCIY